MSIESIHSIVVPLDGSSLAEHALPFAEALAQRANAKLKLVLIHAPNPQLEPGPEYVKVELAMQKADREYLRSITGRLRVHLGRSVTSAVIRGAPVAQTLSVYSREIGADLIVMTTHGRGGLRRAWLGSVADQLIRTSDVPLLVIRPGESGTAEPVAELREIVVPLDGSELAEAVLEPAAALARLWERRDLSGAGGSSNCADRQPTARRSRPDTRSRSLFIRRDTAQHYLRDVAEQLESPGSRPAALR